MIKHIFYISAAFLLVCCNLSDKGTSKTEINEKNTSSMKNEHMRTLINRIGFLSLPYSQDINNESDKISYEVDFNSIDTLIFDEHVRPIVGALPDTTNYFGFLYYGIGDDLFPFIITYDKNGNLIDDKSITIGYCTGFPFDYDSCIDKFTIQKDYSISMINSMIGGQVEYYDSIAKDYLIDTVCYNKVMDGKILPSGKIVISEIKEDNCN